ncbi:MAG TPA: glycoside hydrolase family 2 TIM barrel-domain containing protein, partial [Pyrinomonadaceae bacterium]
MIGTAQTIRLDREWQLLIDRSGTASIASLPNNGWQPVRVGLSWNAQFDQLRDYMGIAWYRTRFDKPAIPNEGHVLIRFDAVDYFTEVFVNGTRVGEHEGGYTPFTIDLTNALHSGSNQLVVRVIDPPMDENENRARFPQMMYNEIPHGKQNWYVQTGGIWQPVWLEIKPHVYIERLHVTPEVSGQIEVEVTVSAGKTATESLNEKLSLVVRNKGGAIEFTRTTNVLKPGAVKFRGFIKSPQLWRLTTPTLYSVEVRIGIDNFKDQFGFRSFEARAGKFFLNGKPFFMIGALDQDFYPDTIYTPPSANYVRDQMLKAKSIGLNLLRCHIKVCDPTYLKTADEVGMLVWYEIPSWNDFNHFTLEAAARGEKTFREMVERDWNHPSIVIQSIINESWGADLKQESQRQWLRQASERAKQLTRPLHRLIVDNSACCQNFHVETDIEDNHRYNSMPDYHVPFDKWVADFATHPKWNFSSYGDARRTGQEPLVVSEFGNWGLPKLPHDLPWWFSRDFNGREVTRPAGLYDRFKQFQFERLFRDYNSLAEATQWHQFTSLKHEIEEIRSHASIQGYVITEFTDINWEANGLLDMWRNTKVYAAELQQIQQPDLVIIKPQKPNYRSGEVVEARIILSHYSDKQLRGATARWSTQSGLQGQVEIKPSITNGTTTSVGSIRFNAPKTDTARREPVKLEIRDKQGTLIAANSQDLNLFPTPAKSPNIRIVIDSTVDRGLATALIAAGYGISASDENLESVIITTTVNGVVQQHLSAGGRAIVIANAQTALPPTARWKIANRAGSDLDGNWVTNFNWVDNRAAPFNELSFNKILGFESYAVVPQ